jgi:hypothetical protein
MACGVVLLQMAIVGPPPTEEEFTSLQTVNMNLPAILAVPVLSGLAHNIYRPVIGWLLFQNSNSRSRISQRIRSENFIFFPCEC